MGIWWLFALVTGFVVALDASRIGYDKRDIDGLAAIGPLGWFVTCVFMWAIAVPVYLLSRSKLVAAAERRRAGQLPPLPASSGPSFLVMLGGGIVLLVMFAGLAVRLSEGGGESPIVRQEMQRIEQQVVVDAIDQYRIVEKGGSATDKCVHAGIVAAAYVQAKDQKGYDQWKAVEKKECGKAGMPGE